MRCNGLIKYSVSVTVLYFVLSSFCETVVSVHPFIEPISVHVQTCQEDP